MSDITKTKRWRVVKCLRDHPSCDKYSISPFSCMQGEGGSLEDATLAAAAPKLHRALKDLIEEVETTLQSGMTTGIALINAREEIKKTAP